VAELAVRIGLGLATLLVLALIVAQIFLPGSIASGVEDRLTQGGGEASVEVDAVPAARLVFGDGDRIEVRGSGLHLDVEEDTRVLDGLDGFDEVDVSLTDVVAGPIDVASFELQRSGGGAYALTSRGTTSIAALASGALGGFAGGLAEMFTGAAPDAAAEGIPIELDMELESDDGEIEITSGGGTVAGTDVGPLAEIITAAVVSRL